jgi:predicted small lipoprotein YifL
MNVFLTLILSLTLFAGCSKSGPNPTATMDTIAAPKTDLGNGTVGCDTGTIEGIFGDITKSENGKLALETTAKSAPEKSNFEKLYAAEIAFGVSTNEKLTRLAGCGVSGPKLDDVKAKIAKSQANVTYLKESFPDFK